MNGQPTTDFLSEPSGSESSAGFQIGKNFLRPLIRPDQPMGEWTGLPSAVGAPLSGALWGAGLGALYQGGKNLWNYLSDREEVEATPWWRHPALLGALGGTAVGLMKQQSVSAPLRAARIAAQEKQAYANPDRLSRVIANDPSIPFYEKTRLLSLVDQASPSQVSRMAALAAAGALTASAAYSILGTGLFGSTVVGLLGAGIANNLLPGKPKYV